MKGNKKMDTKLARLAVARRDLMNLYPRTVDGGGWFRGEQSYRFNQLTLAMGYRTHQIWGNANEFMLDVYDKFGEDHDFGLSLQDVVDDPFSLVY
jgi:hypothetical protein